MDGWVYQGVEMNNFWVGFTVGAGVILGVMFLVAILGCESAFDLMVEPGVVNKVSDGPPQRPPLAVGDWSVRVNAYSGDYWADVTVFGVREGCSEGYDVNKDFAYPPSPPRSSVAVYFPHFDWEEADRYAVDFRGRKSEWKMEVWSDMGKDVRLEFDCGSLISMPSDEVLFIRDLKSDSVIYPMRDRSYTFGYDGVRKFTIGVATRSNDITPDSEVDKVPQK
jgi:hypothetical protein